MGVYIKGMDMPKWCGECRFAVDGWCYAVEKPNKEALANNGVTNWCPLVEVPKHGRLVDADALMETIHSNSYVLVDAINSHGKGMFAVGIKQAIDEAPTVIEAED